MMMCMYIDHAPIGVGPRERLGRGGDGMAAQGRGSWVAICLWSDPWLVASITPFHTFLCGIDTCMTTPLRCTSHPLSGHAASCRHCRRLDPPPFCVLPLSLGPHDAKPIPSAAQVRRGRELAWQVLRDAGDVARGLVELVAELRVASNAVVLHDTAKGVVGRRLRMRFPVTTGAVVKSLAFVRPSLTPHSDTLQLERYLPLTSCSSGAMAA
jgi:hypothetical protein